MKLFTDNIVSSFTEANFAAVVFFAIFFGVALAKVMDRRAAKGKSTNPLMDILEDLDAVLILLINWIIMVTPFAVLSLIIKAVGSQSDLAGAFANVGYLVLATIIAMILQVVLIYMGLFFVITRANPLKYLRHVVPAQTMAFACSSSAATIPMTIRSVLSTGYIPETIARFVIPLGATVNMDGGAIYFTSCSCWLAVLNGIQPTAADYILLVIISTLGSIGTAPVPSASLVLIITAYNTVFNTTGIPEGFSFVLAIDWFMDRLRTTMNVTGDTVVCAMVAHLCPLNEDEHLPDMSEEKQVAVEPHADESDAA
jgi:Na+/H+-dicarboxylate symporter